MLRIVWGCLWTPSEGGHERCQQSLNPSSCEPALHPRALQGLLCAFSMRRGQTTVLVSASVEQGLRGWPWGPLWGQGTGRGGGWPWEGKWERSEDQVCGLVVVLLRVGPDGRNWKFVVFPLTSRCGEGERVSCSPGSQVEEEGAGGGLGCLGPKQACLPACLHTNSPEVWVLSPALGTIQIKMTKSSWRTVLCRWQTYASCSHPVVDTWSYIWLHLTPTRQAHV